MAITLKDFPAFNDAAYSPGDSLTGTVVFTSPLASHYRALGYELIVINNLDGQQKTRGLYSVRLASNVRFAAGEVRSYFVTVNVPDHPAYQGNYLNFGLQCVVMRVLLNEEVLLCAHALALIP